MWCCGLLWTAIYGHTGSKDKQKNKKFLYKGKSVLCACIACSVRIFEYNCFATNCFFRVRPVNRLYDYNITGRPQAITKGSCIFTVPGPQIYTFTTAAHQIQLQRVWGSAIMSLPTQ